MKENSKRISNQVLITSAFISSLLVSNSQALAADSLLTLGEPALAVNGLVSTVASGDGFVFDAPENVSIVCEGIPSDPTSEFAFSNQVTVADLDPITAIASGNTSPQITGGVRSNAQTRIAFTSATSARYRVEVATAKEGGEPVRIQCKNSSLFGRFNTFVNRFNFLELVNFGGATVNLTVRARDFKGEEHTTTVTIKPLRRADIDLHSLVGENNYGTIKVTHDGSYHSIKGNLSMYSGTAAAIILRGGVPLVHALE